MTKLLLVCVLISGCAASHPAPADPSKTQVLDRLGATTSTTTVADLEATLGHASKDIGSGIHIFVYPKSFGEVRIGSADGKEILYVRVTEDGRERVVYDRAAKP